MKECAQCLDKNRITYGPDTETGRESIPCRHVPESETEAIVDIGGFLVRMIRENPPRAAREIAGAALLVGLAIGVIVVLGIAQGIAQAG